MQTLGRWLQLSEETVTDPEQVVSTAEETVTDPGTVVATAKWDNYRPWKSSCNCQRILLETFVR